MLLLAAIGVCSEAQVNHKSRRFMRRAQGRLRSLRHGERSFVRDQRGTPEVDGVFCSGMRPVPHQPAADRDRGALEKRRQAPILEMSAPSANPVKESKLWQILLVSVRSRTRFTNYSPGSLCVRSVLKAKPPRRSSVSTLRKA